MPARDQVSNAVCISLHRSDAGITCFAKAKFDPSPSSLVSADTYKRENHQVLAESLSTLLDLWYLLRIIMDEVQDYAISPVRPSDGISSMKP